MERSRQTAAIIVAAGRGTRAGSGVPKQWRTLVRTSVAEETIAVFTSCPLIDHIVLVVHADDLARARAFPDVQVVTGGASRTDSVRAGLNALDGHNIAKVLIHDVARPLVTHQVIEAVVAALDQNAGAAPAIPVTDALWRGENARVAASVERRELYRAQTPQGFQFETLQEVYRTLDTTTADDVEAARRAGVDVAIVPGDPNNLKLTYPADFDRARRLMKDKMDIRLGNGFDVHAFEPGDHVILCGVPIPHDNGLKGHSDADVAMHALTDAIYGAMAEGDIGRHFPPSDPQWKGADSALFLRHAVDLARDRGFTIGNVDVTIICELPKIGPHAAAMTARIAKITGLEPARVSIKATTSERLGFTGRGEGIAALASATLVAQ